MDSEVQMPLEVSANPLPGIVTTILRYVAQAVAGYLVAHGALQGVSNPTELVLGVLSLIAITVWGAWRTWRNHAKLVVAGDAAPNTKVKVIR